MVTAIAVTGLGLGASQVIKSPAQAAADTAAPPPSVMTAPVERRILRDSVIVRGTVTASQTVEVAPSGSGQEGAGSPVVTRVNVGTGDTFRPGRALMEVSGRPVIALKGVLPVYRDLKPGAEGKDVAQLQQALKDTGHPVAGDRAGFFGPGTKTALTGLYQSIGYDPLPSAPDGDDKVASSQDAVTEARRHLQDAQSGGQTSVTADENSKAGNRSEDVSRAREDLDRAEKKLAQAQAASGPMLPASEVVYLKGFPARVDNVSATVGSRVSGSVMTVSAGRLVVTGYLSREQHSLVRPGQRVQILSELDGTTAQAAVASVADTVTRPQTGSQDQNGHAAPSDGAPQGYAVTVLPDQALDASLAGQDVRLTIETAATKNSVLVVPVTAVSTGADGTTAVTVAEHGDGRRRVPVTTGASGDGYVEVRPAQGARLAAGDKVITGTDAQGSR
ncbi:peptidoglycan-binding protein [Streptomyces sp. Li-HN-5-11]|uniref:peptidoglycan-binding protein n=1 Tax=Streptomyces sp. Li-HN-5-11 TaxID=3075432 RepID=UPI0028A8285E|nr:peptidoglycan-binding protein [Streptomyces sp. Li-HN-5-11]WNM33660.1 peptidoglycan-binding protein [Streptomyces sp. Li-HN-5-11]